MAAENWKADSIVGIDFGMTCTVAYSFGPDWPGPKHIQKWPGALPSESHNKVETSVAYNVHSKRLTGWGFACASDNESEEVNQYFKLNLDPTYRRTEDDPEHAEASAWFRDYMGCIRKHTIQFLEGSFPRFHQKSVEYIFSVPTTWKDPAMIVDIERNIRDAGFGHRPNERALVTLTEAEAAAVYALKSGIVIGETFLVCDAGGGTSDVNVLRVKSEFPMGLKALSCIEGCAIGSTVIDFKIRRIIKQRLMEFRGLISGDLDNVLDRLMRVEFPSYKCNFGAEGYNLPKFKLRIEEMKPGTDIPEAGIEDSAVVILHNQLQGIFDEQIEAMYGLIDDQLTVVQDAHPHETIVRPLPCHLLWIRILSSQGGLGSSPYVRRKMKERYEGSSNDPANARNMRVLLADSPQLAVVYGLVSARTQRAKVGVSVFTKKCRPISVGVICREVYDKDLHQGEEVTLDQFDKRRWAERQIKWIIKEGDEVHMDYGVTHQYRKKIELGRERDVQKTRLVMSTSNPRNLPRSFPKTILRDGLRELCEIESTLDPGSLRRKNRHWWQLRKEYNLAEFSVRLLVGTGLNFEIVNGNGKVAKKHDEIPVTWEPILAGGRDSQRSNVDERSPELYSS